MQKILNLLTLKNFFIFFLPGTFSLFLVLGSFFYSDKFIFLENLSLDSLQKTFPRNTNENKIFIIDIDEISLEKIGQWPWDRRILAELTKTLKESYNVKVIGFDIIFPEKDRLSNLNPDERDNDTIFSKSIEEVKNVVLPLSLSTSNPSLVLPDTRSNINTIGLNNYDLFKTENSFITNLDELNRFSQGLGYINSTSDRDGLIRKLFLVNNFVSQTEGTKLIPSFSLELARVFLDEKNYFLKNSKNNYLELKIGNRSLKISLDSLVIPYFRKVEASRYISAVDILLKKQMDLENSIVIIGSSATGLKDKVSTSLQKGLSGTEIHVQTVENILDNSFIKRGLHVQIIECLLGVFLTISALILYAVITPLLSVLFVSSIILILVASSIYAFVSSQIFFNPSILILSIILNWFLFTISKRIIEIRDKAYVDKAFGRYVSPALLEILQKDKNYLNLGGEKREMTFLFCDLRNFSKISEIYKESPSKLISLLNNILDPVSKVILDHGGTIDKYLGDAVMAFWNAPIEDGNHSKNAVVAAKEIITKVKIINDRIRKDKNFYEIKNISIEVGIGVNTGYATVGNIGSTERFDYSVIGDPVNLAARLESQCKNYKLNLICGEETTEHTKTIDTFFSENYLLIDVVKVVGRNTPVRCYTLSDINNVNKLNIELHEDFINSYLVGNFKHALDKLEKLTVKRTNLQGYYKMMYARIYDMYDNKNFVWRGFYVLDSK